MRNIVERIGTKGGFSGALISLDQSKVFSKIDHHYLKAIFTVVSFGPTFRDWIAAMHSSTSLMVKVNSHLLELFCLALSIHQGYQLLSLLYVLALKPLLLKLEQLKGIPSEIGLEGGKCQHTQMTPSS